VVAGVSGVAIEVAAGGLEVGWMGAVVGVAGCAGEAVADGVWVGTGVGWLGELV
jgi:hypothetical protein